MYLNPFMAPPPPSLDQKHQSSTTAIVNADYESGRGAGGDTLRMKQEEANRFVDILQRRLVNTVTKNSLNSSKIPHQRNSVLDSLVSVGIRTYRHSSQTEPESVNYRQPTSTANGKEKMRTGASAAFAPSVLTSTNRSPIFGSTSISPVRSDSAGLPKPESIRVFELPPEYKIILEIRCGFCGTFPRPPLRVCQKGHQTCDACIAGMSMCPHTQPFSSIPCGSRFHQIECRFYTFMFLNSKLYCPFAASGCMDTPLGLQFDKHKEECPFRPYVKCPFTDCLTGHISYVNFVDHVVTIHSIPKFQTSMHTLSLPFNQTSNIFSNCNQDTPHCHRYVGAVFEVYGLEFAFVVEEKSEELNMWMASMNNPDIVGKRIFECRFALKSITSNYMMQWDGEVHARDTASTHIISEHDCFPISNAALKKKYVFRNEEEGREFWNIDIALTETKNEEITEEEVPLQISVSKRIAAITNDKKPDLSQLVIVIPDQKLKDTKPAILISRPKDTKPHVDVNLKSEEVDSKRNDTETKPKLGKTDADKDQMQQIAEFPGESKNNSAVEDLDPKIKPTSEVTVSFVASDSDDKTIVPDTPSGTESSEEEERLFSIDLISNNSSSSDDDDATVIFRPPFRPITGNNTKNQVPLPLRRRI